MTSGFCTALAQYGQTVELHYAGMETEVAVRAFLQAIPNHSEEKTVPTPLGAARQDRYLYLGDPEYAPDALGEGGYVLWQGGRYGVRTAHPVYIGDTINHWCAVLEPLEEGDA